MVAIYKCYFFAAMLPPCYEVTAALPMAHQSIDLSLKISKPLLLCHCETLNKIPVHPQQQMATEVAVSRTPDECLDFCIWKLGRRQERRRIEVLMRVQAGNLGGRARSAPARLEENALTKELE